jgi:hypothetical protein
MSIDLVRNKWLYAKRDKLLSLEEIIEISNCYYGARDMLCLFDMTPNNYFNKGIRLLGRTAIECSIDIHAEIIADEASKIQEEFFPAKQPIIIDLFTGSGNLLYHFSKKFRMGRFIGFEKNNEIYKLTCNNLKALNLSFDFHLGDYKELILQHSATFEQRPIIVIIDPPWGKGFTHEGGLDLLKTEPPVDEIIKVLYTYLGNHPLFLIIQVHERTLPSSITTITSGFCNWSSTIIKKIEGTLNTGFLLCTQEKRLFPLEPS